MLLAFLGFVVVLSGFVAYAADNIARRVGRRHLRLFGLRPKTTALIVAVASGMGISLLSVLAFGLLNRQALINLAQAESVRQQLAQLQKSVQSTQTQLGTVRGQRDAAQAQARGLETQRQQAIKARDEANAESAIANSLRDRAVSSRDELYRQAQALSEQEQAVAALRDKLLIQVKASQQQLSRTQAQAAQLSAQVKSTQARLQSAQGQLKETQNQLASSQAQLKTAQAQTSAYQAQVRSLTASRAALQARVNSAQAQAGQATARSSAAVAQAQSATAQISAVQGKLATLSASVAGLTNTRNSLQSQRDRLTRDLNSLRAVRDSLQRDNTTLQQGLNAAVAERDRLQADVQNVNSELSATRSGGLAYRRGELVYSGVVASVGNLPAALAQVNQAAQARKVPSASLSPDALSLLQAKLRGLNTGALVSCRAAANTTPGYPLQLACDAVTNRVLYHQGDVIRSVSVSLSGNTEAVRVQLLDLQSGVLRDLSSRGVPPERVSDPSLSTNALYDLVSQRQNAPDKPQSVTVSILAASDLRPSGPVQLSATVK